MTKKGNTNALKEVKKDGLIQIRVSSGEKEEIQKASGGNVSSYLIGLHDKNVGK